MLSNKDLNFKLNMLCEAFSIYGFSASVKKASVVKINIYNDKKYEYSAPMNIKFIFENQITYDITNMAFGWFTQDTSIQPVRILVPETQQYIPENRDIITINYNTVLLSKSADFIVISSRLSTVYGLFWEVTLTHKRSIIVEPTTADVSKYVVTLENIVDYADSTSSSTTTSTTSDSSTSGTATTTSSSTTTSTSTTSDSSTSGTATSSSTTTSTTSDSSTSGTATTTSSSTTTSSTSSGRSSTTY